MNQSAMTRKAITLLQSVTTGAGGNDRQSADAWLMLAAAQGSVRRWDAAAAAYDKVFALDPNRLSARASAAAAWLAAGQPAQAVRRYEELATALDNGEIWLALAASRMQQQLSQAPDLRNWAPSLAAFTKAESHAAK